MNIDVMQLLSNFIGAFICCFGLFSVCTIISYRSFKDVKFNHYIFILIASLGIIVNTSIFDNVAKIFGTILILYVLFKIIYKKKVIDNLLTTIITYVFFPVGEITFVVIVSLIDYINHSAYMMDFVKTPFANIGISIISCFYAYLLRKYINKFIKKCDKNNIIYILLVGLVTLFIIISSIFNLYHNNWVISQSFILNTIIIVGCISLIFVLIRQYLKNKEITDKYELLEEYMKTSADLIEKYSSTIHKYKNNLITIKGYMKSDMKEANKYVDSLLDNFKNKKYSWFSKINNINIDTIRYLVYYKLSKAEESNLKISVNVSKEVKEIENKILDSHELGNLLEILGEYFDNAIYASSESDEKELNFDLYLENNNLVFMIANTYKNDIDLSLITRNGYTTKGSGHGLGLYDVEKSIKSMKFLFNKYEVIDNYFVVTLTIDTLRLKK